MSKLQTLVSTYFKIKRKLYQLPIMQRWLVIKEELDNQKLHRDYIGEDRCGNKYYQYYSYFGLPTRREIEFKDKLDFTINDLAFYDWLTKRQIQPPTQLELQQFYEEEQQRLFLAKKWDQEQEQLMKDYHDQLQLLKMQNIQKAQQKEEQLSLQSESTQEIYSEIKQSIAGNLTNSTPSNEVQEIYKPDQWKPVKRQ